MTDKHPDNEPVLQDEEQHESSIDRKELLEEIGRQLRIAREHRKISLDEVARDLKLRIAHLAALENGNWNELPGDVYGIGFIRQYAQFLDLDLEENIARIKSGEYRLTKPLTFPDPPIAPAKRWAVSAILLFIILFIALNIFKTTDHNPSEYSQTSSPTTPSSSGPSATNGINTQSSNIKGKKHSVPSSAVPAPVPVPVPSSSSNSQKSTTSAKPALGKAPALTKSETLTVNSNKQNVASAPVVTHTYSFEAVGGDVWLQLYNKQSLLKEVLLRSGQKMSIASGATYLSMNCGNVGALKVKVDNKLLINPGQLGPMGKVAKNFRLVPPS